MLTSKLATKTWRRRAPAFLAAALSCAALAGTAAGGFGSGGTVSAVEGLPFSGPVAAYTSTTTGDERFVAQAHHDLLGRAPTTSEVAALAAFLGNGGTRVQVADALLGTDEYHAALTRSIYLSFLRRPASGAEVAFGTSLLGAGATDEELKAFALGSAEYLLAQGGGTVHGFLDSLYQDVLARPIDPGAEAVFTQLLAGGKTRTFVAQTVLTSEEARQRLVRDSYERLLHRQAAAAEVLSGTGLLDNGATDEDLLALLVGSTEYLGNVPASFASASIAWGDGTATSQGTIGRGLVFGSHTYAEEGAYGMEVVVSDLDGTVAIPAAATVADAPLTATPVSFTAVKKTTSTRTVATFSDANPGGTASEFTASIHWGDGKSSSGMVNAVAGGFSVTGSHRYELKGTYAVTVHIADEGGSTANAVSTATVTSKP
jgi:hypothetical protein